MTSTDVTHLDPTNELSPCPHSTLLVNGAGTKYVDNLLILDICDRREPKVRTTARTSRDTEPDQGSEETRR